MLFLMRVLCNLCNVWCCLIHFTILLGKDGSKPAILKIYSELASTVGGRKRILILKLRKIPVFPSSSQTGDFKCPGDGITASFSTVRSTSSYLSTFSKDISRVRKLPNLKVFGDPFWKHLSSVRQKNSFSNSFLRIDWFVDKPI